MAHTDDQIYKYEPLFGSWNIEEEIGEGSFGTVYLVSKEELGQKYFSAVKLITIPTKDQFREAKSSLGTDESTLHAYFQDVVENIINEVNILHSLSGNNNILNYHDHSVKQREDKIGWDILIRMEYVASLPKYLDTHTLTREQIIQLGIDICSALELCSKKGIVHRDIKDENIFLNQDDVFKLGDFGIARELSGSGRAASMRGTPLYMAPEVYRGEKYDAAVDIYSLGIVLYKLLNNGRMPFMPPFPEVIKYKDSEAALDRRMSGETLPMPVNTGEALGRVVLKACAFRTEDRYASAAEMKRALEQAQTELNYDGREQIAVSLTDPSVESHDNREEKIKGTVSIFAQLQETDPQEIETPKEQSLNEAVSIMGGIGDKLNPEVGTPTANSSDIAKETSPLISTSQSLNKTASIFRGIGDKHNLEKATPIENESNMVMETRPLIRAPQETRTEQTHDNIQPKIMNTTDVITSDVMASQQKGKSKFFIKTGVAIVVVVFILTVIGMFSHLSREGSASTAPTETAARVTTTLKTTPAPTASTSTSQMLVATTEETSFIINTAGNSAGNILNYGLATQQGDWIYFSNNYSLFKIRLNGSDQMQLNSDLSYFINVVGDWIYYSNWSNNQYLYKIRIDGTERTQINSDASSYCNVINDWVFYSNENDNGYLYKIRTDGSERTQLNTDNSFFINVINDWIYYSNWSNNKYIYKIRLDGTDKTQLNSDASERLNVIDDWIFFSNWSNGGCVSKIRTDGTEITKLNNDASSDCNVSGEWIYYVNGSDSNHLYKIRKDGTERTQLNSDNSYFVNVINDSIYYLNLSDNSFLYKIQTDGTERQKVE